MSDYYDVIGYSILAVVLIVLFVYAKRENSKH